jgi:hypothetical protein
MNLQSSTRSGEVDNSGLSGDFVKSSTSVFSEAVTMELHKLDKIELGLSQNFNLSDANVLEGEDGLASLLNGGTKGLWHGDASKQ